MDNIPGYQGAARLSYVPDTLYNIVRSLSCFQHNVYTLLSAHLVMLKCAPRFLVQKYIGESHCQRHSLDLRCFPPFPVLRTTNASL